MNVSVCEGVKKERKRSFKEIHPWQKKLFDISKVTIILTTNPKYFFLKMSTSNDISI